jgi:hypothetical protein
VFGLSGQAFYLGPPASPLQSGLFLSWINRLLSPTSKLSSMPLATAHTRAGNIQLSLLFGCEYIAVIQPILSNLLLNLPFKIGNFFLLGNYFLSVRSIIIPS